VGKIQYQSSCAACHGADAKGDGPVSKELKTRPADLTVLAKNNNGVFPYDRVFQMIDGRNSTVASHGTREMPIWGYRFGPPQAYRFKARVVAVTKVTLTAAEEDRLCPSATSFAAVARTSRRPSGRKRIDTAPRTSGDNDPPEEIFGPFGKADRLN